METINKIMKSLFFKLILATDKAPTLFSKFRYWLEVTPIFSGLIFGLDGVNAWFTSNRQFVWFLAFTMIIHLWYGGYYHRKIGKFDWGEMYAKASKMMIAIMVVYILLDMMRVTIGENSTGEVFKIVIQSMALLWPVSKTLKQVYILNNKEFPPEFIMKRLYNFEKTGDLAEFINNNQKPE